MTIEFDPDKDVANVRKHGISLASAEEMDWNDLLIEADSRYDYGEDRYLAYGVLNNRVYAMVFTKRPFGPRIISLRKANRRERKKYEKEKNRSGRR